MNTMHLLTAFYRSAWALTDEAFAAVDHVLHRWGAGVKLTALEIAEAVGQAPEIAAYRRAQAASASGGGVQVIPLYGILTHRAYSVAQSSTPVTSTEAVGRAVQAAAADPAVGTIVLDIDSPGGAVNGTMELADIVSEAAKKKPVIAVANAEAASAAYWVASQASEVVVTPSGMVGSIGVRMIYTDTSAKDSQEGISREVLSYGKYKSEGIVGPLSEDTRAYLLGMLETYGRAFEAAVARGRGVPIDTVRSEAFGQGRMKLARDAVASGMADRVATLDEVIEGARKARRGMSVAQAQRRIQILEA